MTSKELTRSAFFQEAHWAEFESEVEFREHCFNGKEHGHQLNNDDYHTLFEIKREGRLSQIGEANIWFIWEI